MVHPLASAPALSNAASRPMVSGSWYPTEMRRSTFSKNRSISRAVTVATASSRDQRSSTRSGVRHAIPPLMTVEPPTQRPSETTIGGAPIVVCMPASR